MAGREAGPEQRFARRGRRAGSRPGASRSARRRAARRARLVDRAEQVAHAVGLHPQRHVERGGRHVLEVVGAVEIGGAVHVGGADLLEGLEVLVLVVLRALEHQVLEQVGETGLAGLARPCEPTWYQTLTATIGALRSVCTITVRPLSSVKRS